MTHDVDFYISRGFDRPMAEYMAAGRRRRRACVRAEPSILATVCTIDCKSVVFGH